MKKLGILGSTGKMGRALIALPPSPLLQLMPLSKTPSVSDELALPTLHALIDFSHAHATQKHLALALTHQLPLVIGTTGLPPLLFEEIQKAAHNIPILYSANFSIGITLMCHFFTQYAAYLERAYIDIEETHHLEKKDLPSGTALHLASLFHEKRIATTSPISRSSQDLIIHAKRLPNDLGSHTVHCSFPEERLSLHHEVLSRSVYAQGALIAAQFLLKQKSGLYEFSDVFTTWNSPFSVP
jgi:4-hydroxy-tetrahydrodipicolinate reductase